VRSEKPKSGRTILSVLLHTEHDVVVARQRARDIAELVGFDHQDQTRIATAVSEIARNALVYARNGKVEFYFEDEGEQPRLAVHVTDEGPGIPQLKRILSGQYESRTGLGQGILGARRLTDRFDIESSAKGTSVWLCKQLPPRASAPDRRRLDHIAEEIERHPPRDLLDELRQENQELLHAMEELRRRQEELNRLNKELEETNRGVVALYAELDERAEQLKRAGEAKSRFLSHVSHEFRTPLNSIIALSRLMLTQVDGPLSPEQQKQVTFIRQSADMLLEIVNDLLDISRVESGKTEVRYSQVEVRELFGTLRGMMRPLLTNQAVALVLEDPAGIPPLVTDESKLAQILRNFVSNAVKFTEKGEVRVSARLSPAGDRVTFSVCDTGIGIAPQDRDRIFQEFVQIQNPLQARSKGTGLGLPLTKKLAELLGGSIEVQSTVGAGSTFSVTIPVSPHSETPAAAGNGLAKPKVLIIDDEEIARYLIRQSLAAPDDTIVEAANGAQGLAKVRKEHPQAIFLDLRMPEMNGIEVLHALKADAATRDIPVIVITASKSLTAEERATLEQSAAAVLSKDVLTGSNATEAIRTALSKAGVVLDFRA
jgi:signal transduction histidine kinase/ActR/RegA family two-component response regulator